MDYRFPGNQLAGVGGNLRSSNRRERINKKNDCYSSQSDPFPLFLHAFFEHSVYPCCMKEISNLRRLRQKAGISVRELARQSDEQPTNVSYWERTGKLPRRQQQKVIEMAEGFLALQREGSGS